MSSYILGLILAIPAQRKNKHIEERIKEAGLEIVKLRLKGENYGELLEEWMTENNQKPTAVLKWDEHGGIFGSMKRHRDLAKWCYQNKIAPISVDFAYLDHYGGYMMNLLEESGDTTIKRDFSEMGDNFIELKDIKGKVGNYIKKIKKIYSRHRFYQKLGHVKPTYKYAAYTQSLMNGCRLMKKNKPEEWMRHLDGLFGSDLIFKTQPSPLR